ncbi:hypothetical protein HMPREF9120_02128 [Neisseria sp. oral taxon 020 str. F0370]|nr:hypothetical protein HMPREF9120_02128 [Neisseria sp. oral taxon 020 str. F0370]
MGGGDGHCSFLSKPCGRLCHNRAARPPCQTAFRRPFAFFLHLQKRPRPAYNPQAV